jgi:putative GTP pyrophosphokinase
MTEDEFLAKWRKDVPVYEAWGQHVVERVQAALVPMIAPVAADVFLRIPPKPHFTGRPMSTPMSM